MIRRDVQYVQDGRLTAAGYDAFAKMERDISAMRARLDAVAAVADAAGGATVDTQARAELAAIKAALA